MTIMVLAALAIVLVLLFLMPGSTPRIDPRRHPRGQAVLEQVPVNGTRQWVLIRTEDIANPVVLFVHGGPGTSQLTLNRKNTRALEKHFTVVNWDQRGAGKSFSAGADAGGMRMDRIVDDVIDLARYLAGRFDQRRILLVGHSWGSAISMLAIAKRPELFSAYVGIGQMSRFSESETLSYEWTLEQARKAGDRAAVEALTRIQPPPYTGSDWRSKFMKERQLLAKYGGEYYGSRAGAMGVFLRSLVFSREYTVLDRVNVFRGLLRSVALLLPELARMDLFAEVPRVEIPVYFCLGRHDYEVPSVLAARYVEALSAPRKELVWFEHSSHMPNTEERDAFNDFMIGRVLAEARLAAEPPRGEPATAGVPR